MTRTLVVWCPDWPVVAAAHEAGCSPDAPVAVLDRGRVFASSAAARKAGVLRGQRVREAQARCPALVVLAYDQAVDARGFEPVVAAVEALAPGVEVVRPGMCAVATQGPARYFGGEERFAEHLLDHLEAAGFHPVTGIADGAFAAEQAARIGTVFPPGESARCLAPLPIAALGRPDLVDLLRRLGIRTLGAFAELPVRAVLERFGTDGLLAHRLASGREQRGLDGRRPPPELGTRAVFEPPVERVDQVAFAIRGAAERLVAGLAERDLVCTALRVEIRTDDRRDHEREWRHPRWFGATDVVDRVRWQLQGAAGGRGAGDGLRAGVVEVRLEPEEVDRTGAFAEGLWGDNAPDERVGRALARVQSLLGHEAVVTPVLTGGRAPAERVVRVPWGDEPPTSGVAGSGAAGRRATRAGVERRPWPGALPNPLPARVFDPARVVEMTDRFGRALDFPALGEGVRLEGREVTGWAGPWLVDERWWDPRAAQSYARFQVACADGSAYAIRHENGRWYLEASYD